MEVPIPHVTPSAKARIETLVLLVIRVAENRLFDVAKVGLILLSSSFTRSAGFWRRLGKGAIAALASGSNATAAPPNKAPKMGRKSAAQKNRRCFRNVRGKVWNSQRRRETFAVCERPVWSSA